MPKGVKPHLWQGQSEIKLKILKTTFSPEKVIPQTALNLDNRIKK